MCSLWCKWWASTFWINMVWIYDQNTYVCTVILSATSVFSISIMDALVISLALYIGLNCNCFMKAFSNRRLVYRLLWLSNCWVKVVKELILQMCQVIFLNPLDSCELIQWSNYNIIFWFYPFQAYPKYQWDQNRCWQG